MHDKFGLLATKNLIIKFKLTKLKLSVLKKKL